MLLMKTKYIAMNPRKSEIYPLLPQTRVQEELDEVFQGSDRPPTMADLRELKYLELCMKESLRVFPSVPAIIREIKEEIQISKCFCRVCICMLCVCVCLIVIHYKQFLTIFFTFIFNRI